MSSAIVFRTASRTFRWPSTTFAQVGEHASSKSAMKTFAPELSALIIILRSTGPGDLDAAVLQIRRRRTHAPVGFPHLFRLLEEVRPLARVEASLPLGAGGEQLEPLAAELAVEALDERERLLRQDVSRLEQPAHAAGANCASSVEPSSARVELSPPVTASSTPSK